MSKQKMRGVFAIVLSVVMLLGSVSMGVFAEDAADPAYEIVSSTLGTDGEATVTLKAGESLYLVLDPNTAEEASYIWVQPGSPFIVSLGEGEGSEKARFDSRGYENNDNEVQTYDGFTFAYSTTAVEDWTEETADELLLDGYSTDVVFGENRFGWGLTGWGVSDEQTSAFVGGHGTCHGMGAEVTAEAIYRPVLVYTATEDGTYMVSTDTFDAGTNVLYLLQDKAEEAPIDPAPGGDGEGNGDGGDGGDDACTHEEATEVPDTAKEPTCTEPGKKADKVCPDCEKTIKGEEIPALGHDFGEDKDEPLCSVCKARNPDYVYVPSGPYYKLTASQYVDKSAIREADMPANAEMADYEFSDGKYYPLAVNQKITLKKGEIAYIVIDPTDANGDLVSNVNQLEWYMHIFDTTGFEVATFQREQSGGLGIGREQNEHGLTFAYSYTDKVNWTKETSNNLLLDNYTELVYTSINEAPQFSPMNMCWVAPEGKPGDDMQVGIINAHGKPYAEVNDDYITRLVLAFEAPADDEYTISAYAAGTANVRFLQTAKAPAGTTPGGNTTPATGVDTFVWPVALVALVTMATGVVLCTKKSRAK